MDSFPIQSNATFGIMNLDPTLQPSHEAQMAEAEAEFRDIWRGRAVREAGSPDYGPPCECSSPGSAATDETSSSHHELVENRVSSNWASFSNFPQIHQPVPRGVSSSTSLPDPFTRPTAGQWPPTRLPPIEGVNPFEWIPTTPADIYLDKLEADLKKLHSFTKSFGIKALQIPMFQFQNASKYFLRVTRGEGFGLHTYTIDRCFLGLSVMTQSRDDELRAQLSGIVECINVDQAQYPSVKLPRYMLPIGQLVMHDHREAGVITTYSTNFTVMLDATDFKAIWLIWRRPVTTWLHERFPQPRQTFWMAKSTFGVFRWMEDIGDWLHYRYAWECFGAAEAREMLGLDQAEFERDLVDADGFVGAPMFTTPIWEELCEAIEDVRWREN
ncbi:hypothetical protein V8F20_009056 [Naviculisporaceae sp. PSN 640]